MKNKLSLMVVSLSVLMSCNNADKTSTESTAANADTATNKKDSSDGWVSLFDGKSTAGWHSYGKDKAGEGWKIADGVLYLDTLKKAGYQTNGGGDLVSEKDYGNFDLKLEWKIAPKGNSGIIFYSHEDTSKYKETWVTGPEMQIVDNEGHPDGKLMKHKAGDLYDLISSSKPSAKPVGEWNEAEIMSKDGKLDLSLNGTTVVSTTMWDDNWKKLIAGSKFKSMPDFGTFKKGRIVLQDHGNMVSFRNIKIKEL
ncbi:MAG: DUF1080 domain-containing protein [Ferruginibacter sp.]